MINVGLVQACPNKLSANSPDSVAAAGGGSSDADNGGCDADNGSSNADNGGCDTDNGGCDTDGCCDDADGDGNGDCGTAGAEPVRTSM